MHLSERFDGQLQELRRALAANMVSIADEVCGAHNKKLSTQANRRYGTNGGLAVKLATGQWYDHDGGAKGTLIDLIMAKRGLTFREVLGEYGPRYGISFANGEETPEAKSDREKRQAARAAEQASKQAQQDAQEAREKADAIAAARELWAASVALADTLGEVYLVQHRGIPKPSVWPHEAVRYHPSTKALIVAGTLSDGYSPVRPESFSGRRRPEGCRGAHPQEDERPDGRCLRPTAGISFRQNYNRRRHNRR